MVVVGIGLLVGVSTRLMCGVLVRRSSITVLQMCLQLIWWLFVISIGMPGPRCMKVEIPVIRFVLLTGLCGLLVTRRKNLLFLAIAISIGLRPRLSECVPDPGSLTLILRPSSGVAITKTTSSMSTMLTHGMMPTLPTVCCWCPFPMRIDGTVRLWAVGG